MAQLTADQVKALGIGLASQSAAQAVGIAVNKADALATQSPICVAAAIVATAVSQTTDFGALKVADKVVMIPAVAGNADFITVAVAGDLGQAAVIGNLYLVLRPLVSPADADALPKF